MAACGNYNNQAPAEDCEDCVQVVKTTRNVVIPCTRNTFQQYTVKVPRVVQERVGRQVSYTEMEARTRQVPYTVNRAEQRTRMEARSYSVPVQRTNTRMVSVTKKVPKTIYVDVVQKVPQQYTTTHMECRTKQVPVNYTVQVPETKYRTENYQAPVQKTKTVFDNVSKTVYDTQVRTRCVPVTRMVTKEVPVYNVVARPAAPCPPGMDCGVSPADTSDNASIYPPAGGNANAGAYAGSQFGGYGSQAADYKSEFDSLDKNNDGRIDFNEYQAARGGAAAAVDQGYNAGAAAAAGGQGYNAGAASGGASAVRREERTARED